MSRDKIILITLVVLTILVTSGGIGFYLWRKNRKRETFWGIGKKFKKVGKTLKPYAKDLNSVGLALQPFGTPIVQSYW